MFTRSGLSLIQLRQQLHCIRQSSLSVYAWYAYDALNAKERLESIVGYSPERVRTSGICQPIDEISSARCADQNQHPSNAKTKGCQRINVGPYGCNCIGFVVDVCLVFSI